MDLDELANIHTTANIHTSSIVRARLHFLQDLIRVSKSRLVVDT